MPIFEYRCLGCGHLFWKVVGISKEKPVLACPSCKGMKLKKLISSFNTNTYLEKAEEAGREMLKDISDGQSQNLPPFKGGIA